MNGKANLALNIIIALLIAIAGMLGSRALDQMQAAIEGAAISSKEEIAKLRLELKERTSDRYTGDDAEDDRAMMLQWQENHLEYHRVSIPPREVFERFNKVDQQIGELKHSIDSMNLILREGTDRRGVLGP
ncbi:MAG: hypothetical protein QNJ94_18600 [Alphaproteobacteria bacterium]|nr:hypothetical protein [Alphaproteobacteria bacterium]